MSLVSVQLRKEFRTARISKGYTQEELAVAVGAKQACISNFERGLSELSLQKLLKLSRLLNLDLNKLLNSIDVMQMLVAVQSFRATAENLRRGPMSVPEPVKSSIASGNNTQNSTSEPSKVVV